MEIIDEKPNETKQRHGIVTAWLSFAIVMNTISILLYLSGDEVMIRKIRGDISNPMLTLLTMLSITNVICSVLLLRWKIIGFYGFMLTSIVGLYVNLDTGLGFGKSLIGLIGIAVLYGILQMKYKNQSVWENLK